MKQATQIVLNRYSQNEKVVIDTFGRDIDITEPFGVRLRTESDDGELIVSARSGGGFRVVYRSHGDSEKGFDSGEVQFKDSIISRPGEAGYDHGD